MFLTVAALTTCATLWGCIYLLDHTVLSQPIEQPVKLSVRKQTRLSITSLEVTYQDVPNKTFTFSVSPDSVNVVASSDLYRLSVTSQ